MNKIWYASLLLIVALNSHTLFSQSNTIDSLKTVLTRSGNDTTRVKILFDLTKAIKDKSVWIPYNDEMLALADKNLLKFKGDKPMQRFYSRYRAGAFGNIALLANIEGDVKKALDYHYRALKIRESIQDEKGIAASLNNIAGVYNFQGEYEKALEYFNKSLDIRRKLNDKIGMSKCENNIALIYLNTGKYAKSTDYSKMALELEKEKNDQPGLAYSYNNLGQISNATGDSIAALSWFMKAHNIEPRNSYNMNFIARIYYEMDSLTKAEDYCKQGLQLGKEFGNPINQRNSARLLKQIYLKEHKPAEALAMYELYIRMRDSTSNADTKKSAIKAQLQYDFDKKEILLNEAKVRQALIYEETARRNKLQFELEQAQSKSKSEQEKQQLVFEENVKRLKLNQELKNQEISAKAEQEKKDMDHAAQNKQKSLIIYSIIGGLLIVSVFSFYLFRRFRLTQQQKAIIEKQKELVEEHRKEIIDSITYAKRLQQAIFPPLTDIKALFPESFLLYKPKDIVAGDFYWMEQLGDTVFIAAADCTGHGVPGAMVSIVCSNALNRSVKEFALRDTGQILDKTRELVLETFAKSNNEVKDGMDISLLALNQHQEFACWSGANNQLWYIENGELREITANKQAIGKTDNPKSFTTHTIALNKGIIFYLMTDGYPDQFGGPKGKKFKYKPLQEILVTNSNQIMEKQHSILADVFHEWKGNLEQVDDVTILGIRL
ncbi:MAG: tetratricopeptide repeat protein [Bacteroidia bacterium]